MQRREGADPVGFGPGEHLFPGGKSTQNFYSSTVLSVLRKNAVTKSLRLFPGEEPQTREDFLQCKNTKNINPHSHYTAVDSYGSTLAVQYRRSSNYE